MTTENQDSTTTENTTETPANTSAPATSERPARTGGFRSGPRRDGDGDGDGGRPGAGSGPRRTRRPGGKDRFASRRRVDQFGIDGIHEVDYKDFQRLRRYLSDRGKIEPRRKTGLSAFHQRSLTTAIKRARYMALLPYVANQSR
ncbi:MAG: 30S ribosomal protein S18 [Chloroflexi bacterium]|nr:30S ribosomal protein S18 [Chloroflexota bacterium]